MPAPFMNHNTALNALASQSLAVGASVTFDLTLDGVFEGQLQLLHQFPNVAPTSTTGLQVTVWRLIGTGPQADNQPVTQFTVPSTQNVSNWMSFALPTGKYRISIKNTDTTSAVTVGATLDTISSVQ